MGIKIAVNYQDVGKWQEKHVPPEFVSSTLSALLRRCGVVEGDFTAILSRYEKMAGTKALIVSGREKIWIRYLPLNAQEDTPILSCSIVVGKSNISERVLMGALKSLANKLNHEAKKKWQEGSGERAIITLERRIKFLARMKSVREKIIEKIREDIEKINNSILEFRDKIKTIRQK